MKHREKAGPRPPAERLGRALLAAAFWLAVWALAARWVGRELLLPSPLAVGRALGLLVQEKSFWHGLGATLGRVCAAFLLGGLLGMALGAATAAWRWWDALLSPALRAVRTVPVVSFILLLYFLLPTGRTPVAVSALMVLPVVWRATRQGLEGADPALLELCKAYRLGPWRSFRLARLGALMPSLAAGWETGLGLAWKSALAAEVLCQPKWAAGSGLQAAKATLDTAGVAAWTVAVVAVSLTMEALLRLALRRWRGGAAA